LLQRHSVAGRGAHVALAAVLTAASFHASPVRACGPDFPPALLARRDAVLATLPDGDFAAEVQRLVPRPPGTFAVVENDGPGDEGAIPAGEKGVRAGGGAKERALYLRGARAFRAGGLGAAGRSFRAVLALSPPERRRFSTLAAFMLGRMGPDSGRWFAETRALATAGFEDPLGLALASLGEEARRKLDPAVWTPAGTSPPSRDDAGAVRLYAAQAALGSGRAVSSLLLVARRLVDDPARLDAALGDPVVERLITTYAWARGKDTSYTEDAPRYPVIPLLERLAATPHLAGADRLAAAAWRAGRFDLAERFAGGSAPDPADGAVALWVKSRLALRRGDRAAAERLLAEAEARTPPEETWDGPEWSYPLRVRHRLEGERAALALARDDRAAAFEHLLASGSWVDLAHVAERVLDTDALRAAVDRGVRPARSAGVGGGPFERGGWDPADPARRLRDLLARRLAREGKLREAIPYYADPGSAALARDYADALESARSGNDLARAGALHRAARLARVHGMELMGTELAPDWSWLQGDYDPRAWDEERRKETPAALPPLLGEAERRWVAGSAPRPDVRFHYRAVAADHAEAAAALVPPRTQAYAALLCQAYRAVQSTDPPRAQRIYRAYVARGAPVAFVGAFGGADTACPAPDLTAARHPPRLPWVFHRPRKRTAALWLLAALGTAGVAAAGLALGRRAHGKPTSPA